MTLLKLAAVHYRAWTESTLHKFEDTWLEQRPLEFRLGHGELGLEKTLGSGTWLLL
jgi:hypothetical protein